MNMTKNGWMLTTVPLVWWIGKKVSEIKLKKQDKVNKEIFENLKKLHELKEVGVITENEFNEMKERLKNQL